MAQKIAFPYLFEVSIGFGDNLPESWLANKEAKKRKIEVPNLRSDLDLLLALNELKRDGAHQVNGLDDFIEQIEVLETGSYQAKARNLRTALALIDERYGANWNKISNSELPFVWYDGDAIEVEYGVGMPHERKYERHMRREIDTLNAIRVEELRKLRKIALNEAISSDGDSGTSIDDLLQRISVSKEGSYAKALELHRLTLIDPATGLLVPRGYVFERLLRNGNAIVGPGNTRKILTLDVCSMKNGNSNIGEGMVDLYLAAVVRGISKSLRVAENESRFSDLICRNVCAYRPNGEGGDEIVVDLIMKDDPKFGQAIARRIMSNVYLEQVTLRSNLYKGE
ncbi:hypothetical protein CL619_05300 [archaeon]|nr:hypothetical protein [archaeon]